MVGRLSVRAVLLAILIVPFIGCGSSTEIDSITISPATVSVGTGSTAQLTATGTVGHGSHPAGTENVTTLVTWTSSATSVATVSSGGLVTGVGAGSATVTAEIQGFGGPISSTATITVTGGGGKTGSGTLSSLSIIPGSQAVSAPGQTSQYIAIGTTSGGATEDITNTVAWTSSSAQVGKISSTGLATAVGQGSTTITAIASNSDGTVVTGTATFSVTGGTAEPYTAITVSPTSESLSATGQTGQLLAIATSGSTGLEQDVTNSPQVTWTSSIPTIATVTTSPASPAGQVAGVSPGTTQITAKLTNPNDGTVLTSTATITVTASSQAEPLLSITILPASISTGNLYGTGQFLAYGTFSTPPTVQDITNGINRNGFVSQVNWISALQTEFPITTASGSGGNPSSNPLTDGGLVTAYASGSTSVYVTATNPDGTLVYSPAATFACPYVAPTTTSVGSCNPDTVADPLLVTLTVFNAGLNTSNWLVTAPSATGTPNVIHCGPGSPAAGLGDSVCSAPYPIGANVILTTVTSATAGTGAGDGVAFGGWSYTCTDISPNPSTPAGKNTCTVVDIGNDTSATNPTSNISVGAIFN